VTTPGRSGVRALAAAVQGGTVSPGEVAESVVRTVARMDRGASGLNAFVSHDPDLLLEQACSLAVRLEERRAAGHPGPGLAGVPVAVKDNLCTTDYPTTCGSRILDGFRSPYEATAVRRLRDQGALIVGKTNMDEFGMGSSTERSAFGPTRNPLDPERVPGGSSGGSAAAVAAGMVPVALGSDTGGSVRQPAAFCGVVGIKPSYGAVSRSGLVAFASSLDQVGVFGRTVEDAALLLQAIAGPDPRDSTCSREAPGDLLASVENGADGLVVGVPDEYFPEDMGRGVRRLAMAALDRLARAGAEVRPVRLPTTRLAIPTYYVLAPAEAAANLARYDGVRYGLRVDGPDVRSLQERTRTAGFGAEVKRRILLGTYVLSAGFQDGYYARAQRVRMKIRDDFRTAFASGIDVLFTPTTPDVAFRLGQHADPYRMYLEDVFTVTANLAGLPGASVPIGRWEGLPVGGQLLAPHGADGVLVRAAAALERAVSPDGQA
jgi:aspartyl-tRNA(Asn)/glutamyl-tRNA(Gln) amidotransferase subunit A